MNTIEGLVALAAIASFAAIALQSEKELSTYNSSLAHHQQETYRYTECSALINYFYSHSAFSINKDGACKNIFYEKLAGQIARTHFRDGKTEVEGGKHYE